MLTPEDTLRQVDMMLRERAFHEHPLWKGMIEGTFNNAVVNTDQVLTELTENLTSPAPEEDIIIAPIVATTPTTPEGTVAVKPPACN